MSKDMGGDLPRRPRLRPGLRVVRRDDAQLQVGLDPTERAVLPDRPDVHRLLAGLAAGRRTPASPTALRLLAGLHERGLLIDADEAAAAAAGRASARIGLAVEEAWRLRAQRLVVATGLRPAQPGAQVTAWLVLGEAGEPSRTLTDRLVRDSEPHLVVRSGIDRVRVGPFVSPGLTACLRCLDADATDRDPRYPIVLEEHLSADLAARGRTDLGLMNLALAWAACELATFVDGAEPVTWSATITIEPRRPPVRRAWARHPRCGCCWDEQLAG